MSTRVKEARTNAHTTFEPSPVNVRIKISALWTAMLFVFAYVVASSASTDPTSEPRSRLARSVGSPSASPSSWQPRPTS